MRKDEVIDLIRARVKAAGSMRALAREWGATPSYLCDLLKDRRDPGPKILGSLGLERIEVVTYEPIGGKR